MSRTLVISLALTLTAASPALADDTEADAEAEAELRQHWNVFSLKVGHLYALNRPRESAGDAHPPESEHLLGLVPAYGRVLIPGRLLFEVAAPFFANLERFDTPLDLTLLFPFRFGRFEPYFAVGGTINFKIFPGERGETEGTGVEVVGGFTGGIGLAYLIDDRWVVEIELTYAWIPTSAIVEHELAQLFGLAYAF